MTTLPTQPDDLLPGIPPLDGEDEDTPLDTGDDEDDTSASGSEDVGLDTESGLDEAESYELDSLEGEEGALDADEWTDGDDEEDFGREEGGWVEGSESDAALDTGPEDVDPDEPEEAAKDDEDGIREDRTEASTDGPEVPADRGARGDDAEGFVDADRVDARELDDGRVALPPRWRDVQVLDPQGAGRAATQSEEATLRTSSAGELEAVWRDGAARAVPLDVEDVGAEAVIAALPGCVAIAAGGVVVSAESLGAGWKSLVLPGVVRALAWVDEPSGRALYAAAAVPLGLLLVRADAAGRLWTVAEVELEPEGVALGATAEEGGARLELTASAGAFVARVLSR